LMASIQEHLPLRVPRSSCLSSTAIRSNKEQTFTLFGQRMTISFNSSVSFGAKLHAESTPNQKKWSNLACNGLISQWGTKPELISSSGSDRLIQIISTNHLFNFI
jgi:hypothetical protein